MAETGDMDDPGAPEDAPPPLTPEEAERELQKACAALRETDVDLGRRFLLRNGGEVLFVELVGWHVFDGRRWKEDQVGNAVRRLAQVASEAVFHEGRHMAYSQAEQEVLDAADVAESTMLRMDKPGKDADPDDVKEWNALNDAVALGKRVRKALSGRRAGRNSWAKAACGTNKINNMLTEAAPHRATTIDALNVDLYALNCRNGTLRFAYEEDEESDPAEPRFVWRVRLDEHRRADMLTKLAEADYRADAPAKAWRAFLARVQPDQSMRRYLQRLAGYTLLGIASEQMMAFFHGIGRNGKSTFIDTLCRVLGDYSVTMSIDSFSGENRRGGSEATPDIAQLPGARLVAASEPESNVRLKESLIKELTGGERKQARRLHQDFFTFDPQFTLILSGNHKPIIIGNDDGIWRRIHLVPWDVQIPREEVDKGLGAKLLAERDGILAWAVEGAIEFLTLGGLEPPQTVLDATQEYREDQDPIGTFLRNACIVTGSTEDTASPHDLYVAFEFYTMREGLPRLKDTTFNKRMPDYARRAWPGPGEDLRTFSKGRTAAGSVYRGIFIREEWRGRKAGDEPPDREGEA